MAHVAACLRCRRRTVAFRRLAGGRVGKAVRLAHAPLQFSVHLTQIRRIKQPAATAQVFHQYAKGYRWGEGPADAANTAARPSGIGMKQR